MAIFQKGDTVNLEGTIYTVRSLLGEGGQGEVYLVEGGGERLALKMYKGQVSDDFRYNLQTNVENGAPSKAFLWPKQILTFDDGTLGYFMDLRPSEYVSFVSLLTGKNAFKSQALLLKWCIELCMAFKKLHELGYAYQDLNDGSFFLNPDTGELLICDNDNVTANKKNLGILGKMRYMAPELVRGDKDKKTGERLLPDVYSDRFSLAVILFLALCLGNPYEGERLKNYDIVDEDAEYEMFGAKPIFVYHKTDKSNRPIRGYHSSVLKRWAYLPLYIKEAFHRTFVEGLTDRENERTTPMEWIKLLVKYRDELITCPRCGHQFILGLEEKKLTENCPLCNEKVGGRCALNLGRAKIVLEPSKQLFASHLDRYSGEYNQAKAEIIRNKNNPALWGIKGAFDTPIEIKDDMGTVKVVPVGGVIPIVKNLKIKFSETTIGEIKVWNNV